MDKKIELIKNCDNLTDFDKKKLYKLVYFCSDREKYSIFYSNKYYSLFYIYNIIIYKSYNFYYTNYIDIHFILSQDNTDNFISFENILCSHYGNHVSNVNIWDNIHVYNIYENKKWEISSNNLIEQTKKEKDISILDIES